MPEYFSPTHDDNDNFLLRLYFGAGDPLELAIKRAYGDFSRTQHGLGNHASRDSINIESSMYLKGRIASLTGQSFDQDSFDDWHEQTCNDLKKIYSDREFSAFSIGQAQKWINMALKYIYIFPQLAADYQKMYMFCHIPIDSIILGVLATKDVPKLLGKYDSWSRLDDYQIYLTYQKKLREHFSGSAPLAAEFHLWQS